MSILAPSLKKQKNKQKNPPTFILSFTILSASIWGEQTRSPVPTMNLSEKES